MIDGVLHGKRRTLLLLALVQLLGMAAWFSASAVVPALSAEWGLGDSGRSWLTMSVQLGFVLGALGAALVNLPDRVTPWKLLSACALLAALATAAIPLFCRSLAPALALRVLTGLFLAGVYPVGMKIMATWTREDRGLGIGLLVGALTLGKAAPHLLTAIGGAARWHTVLYASAALTALGALLAGTGVRDGPYATGNARFDWRYAGEVFSVRELRLANFGYLGHMWELYAMWTWVPSFLAASFALRGLSRETASAAGFAVIGAGAVGSWLAGRWADRLGRTTITIAALAVSGACCLLVGMLFGGPPLLVLALCLVWGFAVVADSAQFSACVTELCRPEYIGTALTLQTSVGFLLTMVTIRLLPWAQARVGWGAAFAVLAIGPVLGIWAMARLRAMPVAVKLAGGRR